MTYLTLADVKNRFSEVVSKVEAEHDRVIVTKHGRPSVVLMAVEDLEGLEETLEIMRDPEMMASLAQARTEVGEILTNEEALARISRE